MADVSLGIPVSRTANTGYAGKRATVQTTSYRPISGVRLVPSDADKLGDGVQRTTECGNCGKQRYTFERCQHCGNVHWNDE